MRPIILISFLLTTFFAKGQEEAKPVLPINDSRVDLKTQHDFILENSRTYVNNKVVKIEWLNKFFSNATDSLQIEYAANKELKNAFSNEKNKVEELQIEVENVTEELATVNLDKDSITLFGSPTTKGAYKTTMWSIIIVLLALLLFFLYKFKSSNSITKDANEKLTVLELELETTKKKTRTREQELMRKLQDEINKNA